MIDLANAQIKQGEAAGTPQPFGQTYDFNPIYYSKAGGIILDIHQNLDGNYSTLSDIKSRLQYMSYILANDKIPSDMKEVLSWVNNR